MATDLVQLSVAVREATGRQTTDADRARISNKISRMSQAEETVERALLKRLLDSATNSPARPHRNQP